MDWLYWILTKPLNPAKTPEQIRREDRRVAIVATTLILSLLTFFAIFLVGLYNVVRWLA